MREREKKQQGKTRETDVSKVTQLANDKIEIQIQVLLHPATNYKLIMRIQIFPKNTIHKGNFCIVQELDNRMVLL